MYAIPFYSFRGKGHGLETKQNKLGAGEAKHRVGYRKLVGFEHRLAEPPDVRIDG